MTASSRIRIHLYQETRTDYDIQNYREWIPRGKSLGYTTTWGYGWDSMLDAAQALIDVDWKTGLDKVTWSHVLDHYMNSIEIKAYCTDTERRVRAEYK